MKEETLFVHSYLEKFKNWNSVKHAEGKNYPTEKGPLFIHRIIVDDLEKVAENCRYGAPAGKMGASMLWCSDLTWWLSDNPKASATGFDKPKIDQIPFKLRPKRDQITSESISRAYLSPGYAGLFA